ncbi:hypothetical protein Rhopal_007858-T1 [Rhodotorula paludigena]|uniref:Uncharacterized protein n=1 Tax=Rhodotorula paludigena TaxID=86838 RepID=A0AAV5GZ26_9BASI|nr:hypothetical protein Rhopal_007858-T1 [Rhodotorula paludigena]
MLGLLSRATANLKNPLSPAGWRPEDPVPSGFSAHKSSFAAPISSLGTFAFHSVGHYGQGTIVFERAAGAGATADPPSYGDTVSDKPRAVGNVEIAVEARTNSDGLYITTSDAPIILSSVRCGRAKLHNENNLDPNKGALKNFEDLISGSIVQAERIDLMCENGPISGSFCASGAIVAHTTNFAIKGDFDASSLRLSTTNAEMSGSFRAKRDIVMTDAHGKVEGEFHAPLGCQIKGQYVAIKGSFEVGSELKLLTSVFRIDATIRLLASSSSLASLPPVTRVDTNASSTAELPTFEDAMASSSSSGGLGVVTVVAETTDAGVELVYESQPAEVALRSIARSSGGSKVGVTHPAGWEGRFSASTSLTHTATLTRASATPFGVVFDVEKRSEISGTVGTGETASRSRSVVEAEGEAEIVLR